MRRKIACLFAACLVAVSSVSAAMPVSAAISKTAATKKSAEGTGFVPSPGPGPTPDDPTEIITINGDTIPIDDLPPYGFRFVITTVPEAEQDKAPCKEIKEDLLAARDEISKSKKPGITFMTEEDEAKFNEAKTRAENAGMVFVCDNLFDASIVRNDNNQKVELDNLFLDPELVDESKGQKIVDNKITLTLCTDDADDVDLVMHREKGEWQVVDFVKNGNGTLTFTLDSLCPIAYFTGIGSIIHKDPDTPDEPPTPTPPNPPHPKPDPPPTTTTGYTPPHPVPSTNEPTPTPTNETPTVTPVSDTTVTESPNTGTGTGSALLVSAILATLAGAVLVIKAKKE